MILTGALVNGLAIVAAGVLGTLGGKLMPGKMKQTVVAATALVSIGIGISGAIGSNNQLIPILSLVIGSVIGELLHIEAGVERIGGWLQSRFSKLGPITEGFVNASLVFAVGAMAVMGGLDSGLKNDHSILFAKSVIDFSAAVAFASSMGIGVAFSGLSVFAVEGVVALLASLLGAAATLLCTFCWTYTHGVLGAGYASLAGHALTLFCCAVFFLARPSTHEKQ